jgi:drug/metabolite transporter (DMT)-like permease
LNLTKLAALTGATIISFSAIFYTLSGANAMTGAFFRVAYALPVLFVVWWIRRKDDHRTGRQRWLALGAGIALALDMIVWHTSIGYIGAGLATLIANTQVVLVAVAAWVFFSERPNKRVILAIPIVLLGVTLVSGLGQDGAFGSNPVLGTVLALMAAVFYAFFILVMKFANPGGAPSAGPLFEITAGGLLTVALIGAIRGGIDLSFSWPQHGWLLALALGPQVVAWLLIGYALPRLPAAETATIVLLQPALTMVWGALIFSERPSTIQILGAVVVLLGVALAATARTRPRPRPKI